MGVLAAGVLVGGLASCRSPRYSRDQVRDRWVNTYVRELDLTKAEAECIVDRFFDETDDETLKPLTTGSELSDAQAQRIGELALLCGVGGRS